MKEQPLLAATRESPRTATKTQSSQKLKKKKKTIAECDIISQQSEWPSSKNLQTINAGEGVEKREPSYTVGGNVN